MVWKWYVKHFSKPYFPITFTGAILFQESSFNDGYRKKKVLVFFTTILLRKSEKLYLQ
jgi:hypothetical protein